MASATEPLAIVHAGGIIEVRGVRVMLDAQVALAFGTETKRINEAVARNPDKFTSDHAFQLTHAENRDLRSHSATSKSGRGGARHLPHVFTMKGVARLATVLSTDAALRATDLIIDTFLNVYGQIRDGRARIAIAEPARFRPSPERVRAIRKFKSKLIDALTALLDTVVDAKQQRTVRDTARGLTAEAARNLEERLRTKGIENSKLQADTSLVLAQAEQILASARKTQAEADGLDIQNLERRIDVVHKLIELSKSFDPVEFVGALDAIDAFAGTKRLSKPSDVTE